MKCFVTGGSGFIGSNLVHALQEHGHEVRVLLRPKANLRGLAGAAYETVRGDLTDQAFLTRAMRGCDWCFHLAASYHLWLPDYAPMYAANVDGTRRVIQAAADAGCSRIVHTSTVGCVGLRPVNGHVVPSDEQTPGVEQQLVNPYKESKWQAERAALALAERGWPVVIVNPSAPVGPRDVRPTPTGQIILDFLRRRMPAYIDTGLNFVHVRDVVVGHMLAAEKGRIGERYILGNKEGNWTLKQALDCLAEVSGLPAPRLRLPYGAAMLAACAHETLARFTGRSPQASFGAVRMARHKMFYNPDKAIRELGLPQTPPRQALAEAVAWFRQHGYDRQPAW